MLNDYEYRIITASLVLEPRDDIDQMVDLYDRTLTNLLDGHALLRTKNILKMIPLTQNSKNINAGKVHGVLNSCSLGSVFMFIMKYSNSTNPRTNIPGSAKSELYNKMIKAGNEKELLSVYRIVFYI